MVERDIVFTALNPLQQVVAVGHQQGGIHVQLLRQQLAQFHFKAGQVPVLFEAVGRHVSFKGNAQLAPIVNVID